MSLARQKLSQMRLCLHMVRYPLIYGPISSSQDIHYVLLTFDYAMKIFIFRNKNIYKINWNESLYKTTRLLTAQWWNKSGLTKYVHFNITKNSRNPFVNVWIKIIFAKRYFVSSYCAISNVLCKTIEIFK